MLFIDTKIKGAYIIDLEKREDKRGFFARAWCRKEFAEHGLNPDIVQSNISLSYRKGTLRGMHYQIAPDEEDKLVRCTAGQIFDVLIDLRKDSATYKQWIGIILSADNYRMLYIPKGCAHGYQTLADNTEVFYGVSQFYAPQSERGVRWNDPAFSIDWPLQDNLVISEKDKNWSDYVG